MTDYTRLLAELASLQDQVQLNKAHRYRAFGDYRPGVTTAIKSMAAPALTRWMVKQQAVGTSRAAYRHPPVENEPEDAFISRMERLAAVEMEHERVSKAAADVGTQVHALVQCEIELMLGRKIVEPVVGEDALYRFSGWRAWAKDAGLQPLATESRLYSAEHGFCGTLDILAVLYGHLGVLDIKPTEIIYAERRLQLCAYRKCVESLPGAVPTKGFINVLPRDGGEISVVEVDATVDEYEASFAAFLGCLGLYRYQADHERKTRKGLAPRRDAA